MATKTLTANAVGTAVPSGDLTETSSLTVKAVGQAVPSASISNTKPLIGSVVGQASVTGTTSVTKRFLATSVGSAVVNAPYIRRRGFGTTTVLGQGSPSGTMSLTKSLGGDVIGQASVTGTPSTIKSLKPKAITKSVPTAILSVMKTTAGTAVGQSVLSISQSITKTLSGTSIGTAQGDWQSDGFHKPGFSGTLIRVKKRCLADTVGEATPDLVYIRVRGFEPTTTIAEGLPTATISITKGFVGEAVGKTVLDATQSVTKTLKPSAIGEVDGSASELAVEKTLRGSSVGKAAPDVQYTNQRRFGETRIIGRADFDIQLSPLEKLTVEVRDILVVNLEVKD